MSSADQARRGLLLVAMEPPASLEEEFNDWYDTEHAPQRRALPGFDSASRWVCLAGWPRWLALYDLASPGAVDTDAYRAVSGPNGTPWSQRILPRTLGRDRIVAVQVHPGHAVSQPLARVARLVAARYPGTLARDEATEALTARAGDGGALLQLRAFATLGRSSDSGPGDLWVLAEFGRPIGPDRAVELFAAYGSSHARTLNIYAPYNRGPGA